MIKILILIIEVIRLMMEDDVRGLMIEHERSIRNI